MDRDAAVYRLELKRCAALADVGVDGDYESCPGR